MCWWSKTTSLQRDGLLSSAKLSTNPAISFLRRTPPIPAAAAAAAAARGTNRAARSTTVSWGRTPRDCISFRNLPSKSSARATGLTVRESRTATAPASSSACATGRGSSASFCRRWSPPMRTHPLAKRVRSLRAAGTTVWCRASKWWAYFSPYGSGASSFST